uniref:Aminotransferase class I/classII large domain-containing protein n=1 Tax=Lotharella oceanica TaxID=641309 RepID=A0A7S2U2F5_9EUKA
MAITSSLRKNIARYSSASMDPPPPVSPATGACAGAGAGAAVPVVPCQFQGMIRGLRAAARGGQPVPRAPKLTAENLNPNVLEAQYAVRGEIVQRANFFKSRLRKGDTTLPFTEIFECNVGNPQAVSQKPITFFRQVLALVTYPELLGMNDGTFRKDAIEKAKEIMQLVPGGSGAYSNSMGHLGIRELVARFIESRDGHVSDPEKIFLTDGASASVKMCLEMLIRGKSDGIMVPIPQYPLYSASIALFGGSQVNYDLNEEKGWGTSIENLREAYAKAVGSGVAVRALVVINPGNPTGQCLEEKQMREIVQFCQETGVVLLADEVYQVNVYTNTPFVSFKKVASDMKTECPDVHVISFHSVSKGFAGECGRRGGYMELYNIPSDVQAQLYKLASITLSPNIDGQIMTGLMVDPPQEHHPSFSEYAEEKTGILSSLKERSNLIVTALNNLEGVSCNPVEGALYAFPRITLPAKAIEAAEKAGKSPDLYYCLQLLDATGIVVVPGSGFGQAPGTFHFRTTILPPPEKMQQVTKAMAAFHKNFMARHT